MSVRVLGKVDHVGSVVTATEKLAVEFYRQMYTIRRFEETALELFSRGVLNGTVHTCIGQESCAVGVINALDRGRDVVFSNHRGHGHYLALTNDVERLMSELMGRANGICGGLGGTQHLHRDRFYSNGVQGGIVPVATGMAFAEKEKGAGAIVAAFLGDGTLGQGVVYESLNIASKWSLPILYVVENNQYAQTTPVHLSHAGDLRDRARPFGIMSSALQAEDVFAVYSEAVRCVELVRSRQQPVFLYLETYRLSPHSKGDDLRPREELDLYREKDPLTKLAQGLGDRDRLDVEESVESRLQRAVDAALEMPPQHFKEYRSRMVTGGVYAQ